jgi:predicted DNA-binding antitoxin AbrB/MazE fold protein
MAITVEATYENGTLKLKEALPLKEHETVRVTIHFTGSRLLQNYGICGFHGTAKEADYFAMDPELDFPPPPEEP